MIKSTFEVLYLFRFFHTFDGVLVSQAGRARTMPIRMGSKSGTGTPARTRQNSEFGMTEELASKENSFVQFILKVSFFPFELYRPCLSQQRPEFKFSFSKIILETATGAFPTTGAPPTTMGWAEWSIWSSCTLTCGSGTRTRTRTHGTLGNDENQIAACNIDPCRE